MASDKVVSDVVEEQTGAPVKVEGAPATEGEAKAGPEVDPVSALRAEVAELRSMIDGLGEQVAGLADFRQKVTEVVTSTVEAAALEAVNLRLQETWAPRIEALMKMVQGMKEASAKADAEVSEVRLHLPLLRQLAEIGGLVERAEKAVVVVRQELARLQPTTTPTQGGDILG